MPSVVKVKVCGITREEDAELALQSGASFLGIILYDKSPRYVDLRHVDDLFRTIPKGKRVAVDVAPTVEKLVSYQDAGFDFFQIHFDANTVMTTVASWAETVGVDRLWLAPRLAPGDAFPAEILQYSEACLIDAYSKDQYGGSGKTSNWSLFKKLQEQYENVQWILAGGLNPENIESALAISRAKIVDINSGIEEKPGFKDHEKLTIILDTISQFDA